LKQKGGAFSDADLDDYLVMFELLDNAYKHHLITQDMVYDAFSYDLEKAYENKEIQEFIKSVGQQEHEVSDYEGFEALAKEMSSITNKR
jgi:hypothetical protein